MCEPCRYCGKNLVNNEEIHAVEGSLYCSKDCAVNSRITETIYFARAKAEEWYNDMAEIVSAADIGLRR